MTESEINSKIEEYLGKTKWQKELEKLRRIILESPLTEEYKWGKPCYSLQKNNVVLIHDFKDYCAILFIKGSLLKDPEGILITQTENVQAGRQIRFTNAAEIDKLEPVLKAYIQEAIEVEKAGLQVDFKKTTEYEVPEEFQKKLEESPALKAAFEALTPGRQRGYLLYFSSAKQPKTREARVEKYIPQILNGKGIDD